MSVNLVPISVDPEENLRLAAFPELEEVLGIYQSYYPIIGFRSPWIGYVAFHDDQPVGACGYKGAPADGKVEIAYWTFKSFEGKGFATQMCRLLVMIALENEEAPHITARTLSEENASTHILRGQGFEWKGEVIDPEDGPVWDWALPKA